MGAADPSYPLFPTMCIIAAALMFIMLFNGLVRQNWNLGVAFLCFWLLVQTIIYAINTIVWADNFDIKLYVYCDIASRLKLISGVAQSMATFIITRRVFTIASLRSVEPTGDKAKRWNLVIEWTLGLGVPLLVGGPLYYVFQALRFQILEGFGCDDAMANDILASLLVSSWGILVPFFSATIYYPRIARVFYLHSRDVNRFLRSNNSISRPNYFRVLALSSIDILFTLPVNITSFALQQSWLSRQRALGATLSFYSGWTFTHTEWEPVGVTYKRLGEIPGDLVQEYFRLWSCVALALVTFGLFGVTAEARASYYRGFCTIAKWFGWAPAPSRKRHGRSTLGSIHFGEKSLEVALESGLGTNPSFVDRTHNREIEAIEDECSDTESKSEVAAGDQRTPWRRERVEIRDNS